MFKTKDQEDVVEVRFWQQKKNMPKEVYLSLHDYKAITLKIDKFWVDQKLKENMCKT